MLRRVAAFCWPLRPVLLLVLPPMLSGAMEVAQGDRHERRRERHGGGGWEEGHVGVRAAEWDGVSRDWNSHTTDRSRQVN